MKNLIFYYLNKHKISEISCILLMILNAGLSLGASFMMGMIIDSLLSELAVSQFLKTLILYLFFVVSSKIFLSVSNVLYFKLSTLISIDIKKNIVKNWFQSDGSVFTNIRNGEFLQILNGDTEILSSLLTDTLFSTINSLVTAVAMIAYLAYLQWDLLVIVLVMQMFMLPMQQYFGKKIYHASEESRKNAGLIASDSQELLTNILRFIGGGLYSFFDRKYSESLKKGYISSIRMIKLWNENGFFCNLISVLVFVTVLGLGGWKVNSGEITVGILVIFIQNSQGLFQPFYQLANLKVELEKIKPSLERLEKHCQLPVSKETASVPEIVQIQKIALQNVTFSYDEEQNVLQETSAVFEKGHIYAIMGESGAGKSTIFNLLLKLWHTNQGKILIDNMPIDDWNTDTLRKSICCVAQEDFILNMSVRDNIVLDDSTISDEEVSQAAELACMQDFAINDSIGENGCTISGGQRQRIALARMFLSKASVILMDEPTAALDRKKTLCIMENIRRECSKKLVIIISHSDDVASYCDETYILKHGKLNKIEKE